MLFNSLAFAVFFLAVLILDRLCPRRLRNTYLTLVSWYFYGFWSTTFLGLFILTTAVDYGAALLIERARSPRSRRWILAASFVSNLGVLGYFKYANFFVENMHSLLLSMGVRADPWVLQIVLPAGISFYTFQSLSYTVDVYRGTCRAAHNFFDFAAFVAFFPQLVAGPIERADRLLGQLLQPVRPNREMWISGLQLICAGLIKKAVFADNLAPLVERVFDGNEPGNTALALAGAYAFALQIYCDFSGYSDMARGTAKMMGVELMRNFDMPYIAGSVTEFWRRWHISLSTWLRDYLYIPLGGSRGSLLRTCVNLLLTMLLGGLWHGASWMFVFWGAWHGLALAFERLLSLRETARFSPFRTFAVFHFVTAGWVLFRCRDLEALGRWLNMLATPGVSHAGSLVLVAVCGVLLAVAWAVSIRRGPDHLEKASVPLAAIMAVICYFAVTIVSAESNREFIYFQF